jgi:hypothetical protein
MITLTQSRAPSEAGRIAVIACGALAAHVRAIARRRDWTVDLFPIPAPLHNRPERIAPAVEALAAELRPRYDRVVLAYGDCGTYGALDDLGRERLEGEHCYDVFARDEVQVALDEEPGTYFLTDFLARTVRAHRHPRARARPPSRAARRLLRPLPPRGLARAAADRRHRGRSAPRRRAPQPAARDPAGGRRGPRATARAAAKPRPCLSSAASKKSPTRCSYSAR